MKIAITGAGGFIGSSLQRMFKNQNHDLILISRADFRSDPNLLTEKIDGCDVLINLAGAPILKRWSQSYKKELYDSRIGITQKLTGILPLLKKKPELFISASAVGIYQEGGPFTEENGLRGNDFLAGLCSDWENEAFKAKDSCRVAVFRLGIVMDAHAGALSKMLPAFRFGLGGRIGSGNQGFSWIHIDDLLSAFSFVISNPEASGIFNLTAPGALTNKAFTKILANSLKRPAFFTVPPAILKLIYGEASVTMTSGQLVYPEHLINMGFRFRFPELGPALLDLLQTKTG